MNTSLLVAAAGVATAGAGIVVGAVAPVDWGGIAQAITAVGVLIVSVGTVITGVMQALQKRDMEETKAVMQETKLAVDGGMTKLLDAKVAEAIAKATMEEQARVRADAALADAAILKERERAAAVASPAPHPIPQVGQNAVPVEVVNPSGAALM